MEQDLLDKKIKKNITLKGSLGVLAYGDLAFTAWRKMKTDHNIATQENE